MTGPPKAIEEEHALKMPAQIGYLLQKNAKRRPPFPPSSMADSGPAEEPLHGVSSESGSYAGSATGGKLPNISGEGSSETPLTWGEPRV